VAPIDVNYSSRVLGQKKFELTNHLGNVLAVVSDKKLADNEPDVKAVYDYYPFGMMMPNRSLSGDYRFGFNGKENINEISGTGNNLDFEGRMFDSRIIRTPSLDPNSIKYPALSPYSFLANNPINVVDYNGKDAVYIAFPSYKADGYPFTGHAGVLLIDNKTGLTKYYEYGRYDKAELGIVRHYAIPDVIIGADGRPTAESLNKVLQTISNKSGKGQEIEGAYIESDKFKEMNDYAQSKLKENTDTQREPYSITGNNCGTFAADVINQDESLNTPTILDPRPVSIIDEYQDNFTPLDYDPKQGTTIEYNEKTVSYDKSSKKTIVSQSWFQKLVNGDKTNTGAQTE
jgi:RHS repeat-associated protein